MYDNRMDDRPITTSGWRRGALVCGCLAILAGVALALLRYGGGPTDRGWGMDDHLGGSIAMGAVIAGVGVVALLARRRRPLLLFATGVALVPICIVSVVLLPGVFIVIGMFLAAASAPPPRTPRPPLRTFLTIALVAALHIAAMFALILHLDARTIATPMMISSTEDVITWVEVALSLGCTALAVFVAWTMPPEEPRLRLPLPPPPPVWTVTTEGFSPR